MQHANQTTKSSYCHINLPPSSPLPQTLRGGSRPTQWASKGGGVKKVTSDGTGTKQYKSLAPPHPASSRGLCFRRRRLCQLVLASVATAGWFHGAPHACSQEWMTGIDQHFSPVLRHNACRTTDPLLGGTSWVCDGVCAVRSENNSTREDTGLTQETEAASIPKRIMALGREVCVVLEPCIGIASTGFDLRVFAQGCHAPIAARESRQAPTAPSPPPSVRRFQLPACVCDMSSAQAARASQRKPTLNKVQTSHRR